ncbi:MAG: DUF3822 family protein [Prolixibacteraceae bacterium]|nr:DUF3822 family protein [Prolixibacteraceae bacterium]
MNTARFIDDSFDSTNCFKYSLSIQCSLNGFSFLITDHTLKKHLVLSEYRFNAVTAFQFANEANKIILDEPLLKQAYQKINIGWNCTREMLCPVSITDKNKLPLIYNSTFEASREDHVIFNELPGNEMLLAFAFPKHLKNFFEDHFPACRLFSNSAALLMGLQSPQIKPDMLIVNKDYYDTAITVVQNNKITFLNHFYTKTDTDCLYYILYAARQFMFTPTTRVEITGRIEQKSELASNLKARFSKLEWKKYNDDYKVSYKFLAEPEHYHYLITQLAQCG